MLPEKPRIKWERYESLWVLQDDDEFKILANSLNSIFFQYRNLTYRSEFGRPYYALKRLTFNIVDSKYRYWKDYEYDVIFAFDRLLDGLASRRNEFPTHKESLYDWFKLKSMIYGARLLVQFIFISCPDLHYLQEINYVATEDLTDEQFDYIYGDNGIFNKDR